MKNLLLFTFSYSPFLWIEVVGPVADILDEAEWMSLIGDENVPSWGVWGQLEGFGTEIGDGLLLIHFGSRECILVEVEAHRETMAGDEWGVES